jgi:hypothetical protein
VVARCYRQSRIGVSDQLDTVLVVSHPIGASTVGPLTPSLHPSQNTADIHAPVWHLPLQATELKKDILKRMDENHASYREL